MKRPTPVRNANGFQIGIQAEYATSTCLGKGGMLELPDADLALECASGILWVTRDGDLTDYILEAGQGLTLARGDRGAVQALRAGCLRIAPLAQGPRWKPATIGKP